MTTQPDWKARAADLRLLAEAERQRAAQVYETQLDLGHLTTDHTSQDAQLHIRLAELHEAYADQCAGYAVSAGTTECVGCLGSGILARSSVEGWVTRDCPSCEGIGRVAA